MASYHLAVKTVKRSAGEPPLDKGQHPVWAVVSTLLLGGFIWWISGSWVIAVAAIWGLLVHEYGHVLAMNALGMGPARIYIIPFLGGVAKRLLTGARQASAAMGLVSAVAVHGRCRGDPPLRHLLVS